MNNQIKYVKSFSMLLVIGKMKLNNILVWKYVLVELSKDIDTTQEYILRN